MTRINPTLTLKAITDGLRGIANWQPSLDNRVEVQPTATILTQPDYTLTARIVEHRGFGRSVSVSIRGFVSQDAYRRLAFADLRSGGALRAALDDSDHIEQLRLHGLAVAAGNGPIHASAD